MEGRPGYPSISIFLNLFVEKSSKNNVILIIFAAKTAVFQILIKIYFK